MTWLSQPCFVRSEELRFSEVEGPVQGRTANGGKRWEQEFLTASLCVSLQFCDVTTAKLLLDVKAERHDLLDNCDTISQATETTWDILSNT